MSKAVLRFKLPEEQEEFTTALNGGKYRCLITDIDDYLRAKLKYGELTKTDEKILQEVRDRLHQAMEDNGVAEDFS